MSTEPGVLYLRRQPDGLHAVEGALPPRTRQVWCQWRNTGGDWQPSLGSVAALPVRRVMEIIAAGPHAYDEYRYVPAQVELSDEEKAERNDRLRDLHRKEKNGQSKRDSELAILIRSKIIKAPMEIEAHYKNSTLVATIQDNATVVYGGKPYKSLSAAGSAAIGFVNDGKPLPVNGFTFWKQRVAGKPTPLPRAQASQEKRRD